MKLSRVPFEALRDGRKVIESRLYDDKRRAIAVGDEILFTLDGDETQQVHAEVTDILLYPTFKELFESNDPHLFGGETTAYLLEQIHAFYSQKDEELYGVVGIRLRVID